jgi:hypothetical protein
MATGGRTARGVLALEEAVAAFPAGGIANAGWVLSVAVARPAARRLGEEALARAPIAIPRRTTRGGSDATEGASTKSRAFANTAIRQWTFRRSMGTGKPAIGTVLSGRDAPPDTDPGLACKKNVGERTEVMDRLCSPPSDSAMPDGDRHHYRPKLPFGKCAHDHCGANATLPRRPGPRLESSLTMRS